MALSKQTAKVIGYVLGLGVFFAPLGWMFCSVWWGWRVPRREAPREDAPSDGTPLRIDAHREGRGGVRVVMRNSSRKKLRIVVPRSLGRALRLVPARPPPSPTSRRRSSMTRSSTRWSNSSPAIRTPAS